MDLAVTPLWIKNQFSLAAAGNEGRLPLEIGAKSALFSRDFAWGTRGFPAMKSGALF